MGEPDQNQLLDNIKRIISIADVPDKRMTWWINQVVPTEGLVFISALPKCGKSFLALYMALCLIRGDKFLHKFKTKKAKILYYCVEDSLSVVKQRLKHMLGKRRYDKKAFLVLNQKHPFQLPQDFEKLKQDIQDNKPDIIFIDPMRRATDADEDSSKEMSQITNFIRQLIHTFGITAILVHHTGKKGGRFNDSMSWLRGSSDLEAARDVTVALKKLNETDDIDDSVMIIGQMFHKHRENFFFSYAAKKSHKWDSAIEGYPFMDFIYADPSPFFSKTKQRPSFNNRKIADIKKEAKREKIRQEKLAICRALIRGGKTKKEISEITGLKLGQTFNRRIEELLEGNLILELEEKAGLRRTATVYILNEEYVLRND